VVRRSQRLISQVPIAATTSASTAIASTRDSDLPRVADTAVTVRPTDTSATTCPPTWTGTTARTEGPSVPV
jgi:hypothetical protein